MELGIVRQKHEFGFQGHLQNAESKKVPSVQVYYAKRNGKNNLERRLDNNKLCCLLGVKSHDIILGRRLEVGRKSSTSEIAY
ncbi:hypothetical protein llap_17020 [Limosa lapponica baueri]|uniref:Uncharacterized protein n=1 Tax=Limosa lapponica baueri TaxID=1758121 RepID=A0A2I0TFX8_LIMLA|nr:hypothetical protein llap_17020 [Limosa lapponica baueri]